MTEILQKFKDFLIRKSELNYIYNGGGIEDSIISIIDSENSTPEIIFENLLIEFLEQNKS